MVRAHAIEPVFGGLDRTVRFIKFLGQPFVSDLVPQFRAVGVPAQRIITEEFEFR